MLKQLRSLPLFPGASKIDPTIGEVTFGDFENRLRKLFLSEFKRDWQDTRAKLPEALREAVKDAKDLQFLCWWRKEVFDSTRDCNVRPYYLPGFSGMTDDLRGYRKDIERIRRIAKALSNDEGLDGVDDARLCRLSALSCRRGKRMKGRIFDVDAYIFLLLFESMTGTMKSRRGDLAKAFAEHTEKDMDKIRKRIAEAKKHLRRHIRKISRSKRALSLHR